MNKSIVVGLMIASVALTVFGAAAQSRCAAGTACTDIRNRLVKTSQQMVSGFFSPVLRAPVDKASTVESQRAVVAIINELAPKYGIPPWFALRIAKVESGFDPLARGSAGELGVFQMKCATARDIGYKGKCAGLLSARVNIEVGLKHLTMAIAASRGNLSLAASKHNAGLSHKRLVPRYVALVF